MAKNLMDQIISNAQRTEGDGNATNEILIPGNKVGLVIGKGGETIKSLQVCDAEIGCRYSPVITQSVDLTLTSLIVNNIFDGWKILFLEFHMPMYVTDMLGLS